MGIEEDMVQNQQPDLTNYQIQIDPEDRIRVLSACMEAAHAPGASEESIKLAWETINLINQLTTIG